MKTLLKLLTVLLISISVSFACEDTRTLVKDKKEIVLCYKKKTNSYLSEKCPSIKECFLNKKITFEMSPRQSPGFSLCYQLEGVPFFAQIKGLKKSVPFCGLNSFFIDQESLAVAFKQQK